jgi:hypothetical protein
MDRYLLYISLILFNYSGSQSHSDTVDSSSTMTNDENTPPKKDGKPSVTTPRHGKHKPAAMATSTPADKTVQGDTATQTKPHGTLGQHDLGQGHL